MPPLQKVSGHPHERFVRSLSPRVDKELGRLAVTLPLQLPETATAAPCRFSVGDRKRVRTGMNAANKVLREHLKRRQWRKVQGDRALRARWKCVRSAFATLHARRIPDRIGRERQPGSKSGRPLSLGSSLEPAPLR